MLRSYVLPIPRRERERSEEIAVAVRWIEKASLPVGELQEIARVHELIDGLGRKLDGKLRRLRRTADAGRWSSTHLNMQWSWSTCSPTR